MTKLSVDATRRVEKILADLKAEFPDVAAEEIGRRSAGGA